MMVKHGSKGALIVGDIDYHRQFPMGITKEGEGETENNRNILIQTRFRHTEEYKWWNSE